MCTKRKKGNRNKTQEGRTNLGHKGETLLELLNSGRERGGGYRKATLSGRKFGNLTRGSVITHDPIGEVCKLPWDVGPLTFFMLYDIVFTVLRQRHCYYAFTEDLKQTGSCLLSQAFEDTQRLFSRWLLPKLDIYFIEWQTFSLV